jgi:hypothetical protein
MIRGRAFFEKNWRHELNAKCKTNNGLRVGTAMFFGCGPMEMKIPKIYSPGRKLPYNFNFWRRGRLECWVLVPPLI